MRSGIEDLTTEYPGLWQPWVRATESWAVDSPGFGAQSYWLEKANGLTEYVLKNQKSKRFNLLFATKLFKNKAKMLLFKSLRVPNPSVPHAGILCGPESS